LKHFCVEILKTSENKKNKKNVHLHLDLGKKKYTNFDFFLKFLQPLLKKSKIDQPYA